MRAWGWAVMDEETLIRHWATEHADGKLSCSCGWESEPPEGLSERWFRRHAQVEWVNLLIKRGRLQRKETTGPQGRRRRAQASPAKPPKPRHKTTKGT